MLPLPEAKGALRGHKAKSNLESIGFKYPKEQLLINEAKYILKGSDIDSSNLSQERLEEYANKIEAITVRMSAQYDTYSDYKNNRTMCCVGYGAYDKVGVFYDASASAYQIMGTINNDKKLCDKRFNFQ